MTQPAASLLDKLDRQPPASEKTIAAALKRIAKTFKVDASVVPADYLAFIRQSNGATGSVGDDGGWVRLDGIDDVVPFSQDYNFVDEGMMLIGSDGGGTGYAIDLQARPAEYVMSSYIDIDRVYMGTTLAEFLNAIATGESPLRPGEAFSRHVATDAPDAPGQIAEWKLPRQSGLPLLAWGSQHVIIPSGRSGKLLKVDLHTGKAMPATGDLADEFPQYDIMVAAVSADERWLAFGATAYIDHKHRQTFVALFDSGSGSLIRRLDVSTVRGADLVSIRFTRDSQQLITQLAGGQIDFWELERGERSRTLTVAGAPIDPNSTSADRPLGMSLDETQFAIADWHGERVVFYDATDGKELRVWPYHTRGLNWSPDGKYLAVARGATVQLIDPQTFAVHAALRHAGLPSAKMLFTPDATRVVSVGSDGVRVFRVADGALLAHFPLDCWGLVVSGDGRHALACEGEKRLARTCRLPLADAPELAQTLPPADAAATGSRLLGQLPAHNVNVECIALSRDGSTFCTGSEDVCVWDVAGALGKRIASPSGMSVADLAMSDDGKRLAVRYYGHSDMPGCIVQVHDKDTGRTLAQTAAADKIVAMALAPDGNWALAACDDDRLLYMDAATGEVILRCMLPFKVSAMAVSPDARTLAIAGATKYALMDATTGEVARTLSTKEGDARALLFSSDGTRLLSLNEPNAAGKSSVALLDTVKGKQLRCYRINSTLVLSHAWWPGEQFFLTGEYDGNLDIWSVEDTKRRGRIRSKIERMFRTIAPLPDGRVLAGGDMPGGLSVWQVVVPV